MTCIQRQVKARMPGFTHDLLFIGLDRAAVERAAGLSHAKLDALPGTEA